MAKGPRGYLVTPHGPLARLDDNLWAVDSAVPGFPKNTGMDRRMCVIKLGDGRLVFHNAVPLDDAALAQVSGLGKPAILIVPNHLHAIDARAFAEKLALKVFTSKAVLDKVKAILPASGTLEDLPTDSALEIQPLAGTTFGEAAYVVKTGPRTSLLFCDAFQNSRPGSGFNGLLFRLLGFTSTGPLIPPAYRLRAVSDKKALKRDLLRLASTPSLVRAVPSHGEIVTNDPGGAIRAAAEAL